MISHRKEQALQGVGEKGSSQRQEELQKEKVSCGKVSLGRDAGSKVKTQFLFGGDGQHP